MTTVVENINPGLHFDLPDVDYHGHPTSLSKSGAMKLLPPSCPAKFKASLGVQEYKKVYDIGSAAHELALGIGPGIAVIPATSRFKVDQVAHREALEQARAEGKTPVTEEQYELVQAMAKALREDPEAAPFFEGPGEAEVSAFWRDANTDVLRRARFDWLPEADGTRLVIPDYKTADSADHQTWAKKAADYGYEMQAAWYTDAAIALELDPDPEFVFIVQEKVEPYLVSVIRLDADALQIGRYRNRQALEIYAECTATNHWPGYGSNLSLALPTWHLIQHEGAFAQ